MKYSILSLFVLTIFSFTSCQKDKDNTPESSMTDDQLILAIQESTDKQTIETTQLPEVSQTTLASDFSESFVEEAYLAAELGFEVSVRRARGSRIGELNRVFFNRDGRLLRRGDREGRGEDGRDRGECFRFVFPLTLTMPNGAEITGNDRNELGTAIRIWYSDNPRFEERPSFQYPLEVQLEDGTTVTVENGQQLRRVYRSCRE